MGTIFIRIAIAVLILSGIGGYAFFESRNLLNGPIIQIEAPTSGTVSKIPVTEITGVAHNIVKINMNDRSISVDESGRFKEHFALSSGNNKIKVSAEDRFGNRTESFVEILYEKPNESLVQNSRLPDYQ